MAKSIKIICVVVPLILLLGVALCLILVNTQGSTSVLKLNTLNLKLGQEYLLKNLINVEKYEIEIEDRGILTVSENSLYAKQCGQTKVYVTVNNSKETIDVKVYAEKVEFSSENIELYINGENSANLNLLVDENIYYGNVKFEFDSDIIDYNGFSLKAKDIGETKITAKVLGLNDFIVCECKVIVKQYGFVTDVNETEIVMVENQSKLFDAIKYGSGEKVVTNFYYDDSIIKIENETIYALSSGTTQIIVYAQTSYNKFTTFVIPVVIEEKLEVADVKFYENDVEVNVLHTNTKADGTYTKYNMVISTNKKVNNVPKFSSGINITSIKQSNNEILVEFYKTNNDLISFTLFDEISNESISYNCSEIEQIEYLQFIEYELTFPNENQINNLYLVNEDYIVKASEENIFNYANLKIISEDIKVSTNENIIYSNGKITAHSVGTGVLTLVANDGSNLIKEITFNIENIKAETISFSILNDVKVGDSVSYEISIQPIYAVTKIEVQYDSEFIECNDNNYYAIKSGQTVITIFDEVSGIVIEKELTINNKYVDIFVNGELTYEISTNIGDRLSINIDDYDKISYSVNGIESESCENLVLNEWNNQTIIAVVKKIGSVTINFYKDNILIGVLTINIVD